MDSVKESKTIELNDMCQRMMKEGINIYPPIITPETKLFPSYIAFHEKQPETQGTFLQAASICQQFFNQKVDKIGKGTSKQVSINTWKMKIREKKIKFLFRMARSNQFKGYVFDLILLDNTKSKKLNGKFKKNIIFPLAYKLIRDGIPLTDLKGNIYPYPPKINVRDISDDHYISVKASCHQVISLVNLFLNNKYKNNFTQSQIGKQLNIHIWKYQKRHDDFHYEIRFFQDNEGNIIIHPVNIEEDKMYYRQQIQQNHKDMFQKLIIPIRTFLHINGCSALNHLEIFKDGIYPPALPDAMSLSHSYLVVKSDIQSVYHRLHMCMKKELIDMEIMRAPHVWYCDESGYGYLFLIKLWRKGDDKIIIELTNLKGEKKMGSGRKKGRRKFYKEVFSIVSMDMELLAPDEFYDSVLDNLKQQVDNGTYSAEKFKTLIEERNDKMKSRKEQKWDKDTSEKDIALQVKKIMENDFSDTDNDDEEMEDDSDSKGVPNLTSLFNMHHSNQQEDASPHPPPLVNPKPPSPTVDKPPSPKFQHFRLPNSAGCPVNPYS